MATGTIKQSANIKIIKNVSIAFTNGLATYSNANIKTTSFVTLYRRSETISSVPISGVVPKNGSATVVTTSSLTFTDFFDVMIVN